MNIDSNCVYIVSTDDKQKAKAPVAVPVSQSSVQQQQKRKAAAIEEDQPKEDSVRSVQELRQLNSKETKLLASLLNAPNQVWYFLAQNKEKVYIVILFYT